MLITHVNQNDQRNRLSRFWVPTGGITPKDAEGEDTHALLVRSGFLRQAHSGIFHLLPLGLRVQEKFERLIDKHMRSLGASKVSLSSISSEELWQRTGRLEGKELLRLKDRHDSGLLLGPTHEEEITELVRNTVKSYKELPLRLYQISRKYRDELRPRQGLLRAKEFLMKDLYTFDHLESEALETYKSVREAYVNILSELKIPYLVADADSGAIGGDTSHEYHFISPKGEDTVFACNSCAYVANEEVAQHKDQEFSQPGPIHVWKGISKDRKTLVEAHIMLDPDQPTGSTAPADLINLHAVKTVFPELDTSIERNAEEIWKASQPDSSTPPTRLIIADQNIHTFRDALSFERHTTADLAAATTFHYLTATSKTRSLRRLHASSTCPSCATPGSLAAHRAVEVGHTFHLGTRYSAPLQLAIQTPAGRPALVQMGCHGIGVSRMIAAVADALADARGLNWPRAVAPFEAVVVPGKGEEGDSERVYDGLVAAGVDAVLDDRKGLGFRYIILQPGAFDTDIKCSLVQDVDGTDRTPYEALSYVWGKSTDTISIDIDGNVVIWLGREDEPVKVYKKYDRPIEDAFQLAKDIAAIPSQNDLEDLLSSVASKDAFMVLSRLFDRTWFERVWVLQELVAAARADVVCGKSSIPWSTFEEAYAQLDEFFSEEIYGDWVFLDSAFRDWWRPVFNRFSVLRQQLTGRWTHPGLEHAILFILGTFITELSATDDRDRLWGVISLIAHDGPIDAALAPDYRKPAPRVFADLARRLIVGTGSLATLHACDHIAADNQPSWAPSWTRINRPIHLLHATTPLRPPPGPPPSISFAGDDVLRARGVRLGAVRAVTPACRVENRGTASWTTAFAPLFSGWEAGLWRVVEGDGGGGGDEKAFRDACREAFLFGFEMGTRTREEDGETDNLLLPFLTTGSINPDFLVSTQQCH
ncbi:putative prolyl-trna synthetase protein [Neofusicoccum parvum UCRNP2]|uniref:proline--tRNA ligase n=1 Tax=Botryosphaeria parva (strain UCR-NP2) TaxID=1287680 RepID=R1GMJ5_BOTPV|nr:putative prolyl-trna synthetase protein [Neofusicoccum parvum UCRNP2]